MNKSIAGRTWMAATTLFLALTAAAPASAHHVDTVTNMPDWYQRLEDPVRVIGDVLLLIYSGQHQTLVERINEVETRVEAIVEVVDIQHIDLEIDGRAARIVRQLRDASAIQRRCANEQDQPLLVRRPQGTNQHGFERQTCICFLNEQHAEIAIRTLDFDEELSTFGGGALWNMIEGRVRETIMRELQAGRETNLNEGLIQDLWHSSTPHQRPYLTLTLESTGERIELWIIGNDQCPAAVNVLWTNVPAQ